MVKSVISARTKKGPLSGPFVSADDGIRTRDLVITNDVRYRLRYISVNGLIIANEATVVNIIFQISEVFSGIAAGFAPRKNTED